MKKIILYAHNIPNQQELGFNILDNPHYTILLADKLSESNFIDADFFLIDTDYYTDYKKIIKQYRKKNITFWGYSNDTSKENILKLYNSGFDNVIKKPENICDVCTVMANPDNQYISTSEAKKLKQAKKVLIIDDKITESDTLIEILTNLNSLYTVRESYSDATNEIKKDNYDLIILNNIKYSNCTNLISEIHSTKLNKDTSILIITKEKEYNKLDITTSNIALLQIPYKKVFAQTQILNLFKLKELQDKNNKGKEVLENVMKYSNKQPIITDPNFLVLSSGNQYFTIKKGEYLFGFLNTYNINYPKNEILTFISNNAREINFNYKYNEKNYEFNISKIYTQNGDLQRYLIIIDDITLKCQLEEQKETFIATLTHDLKSPIRAEQNVLKQMLEEKFGQLNEAQKEIISEMLNSREYMKRMIDNILTRYKCSSDGIKLNLTNNNYKKTIQNAINDVLYIINERKQIIETEYLPTNEEFLYDNIEMQRVLINIIANAAEYTPPNGKITITTEENNNILTTKITDTGYGIEEKDLAYIFDKNVTYAKKYRKVGSGLGLYIAKTIIESHNGNISVQSTPNVGTTFTINLPILTTEKTTMPEECHQN